MSGAKDQVDIDLMRYRESEGRPGCGRGRAPVPRENAWLSLYFRCANAYVRAYKNEAGTAYRGRCPRCGKSMQFLIGPGGTSQRAFEVSC